MKKEFLAVSLAALGLAALSGCANKSATTAPTPMEHEVVSAALMVNPSAQSSYLKALAKKNPVDFDPNDVTASLASFDAMSLSSYEVKTTALTSDKSEYAKEDEIAYTLPDGTKETINLYYGDPKEINYTITASAEGETEDDEWEVKLHGNGFRSGAFNGMLKGDMEIDDFDDEVNATVNGLFKTGIAIIKDTEYQFYSEELKVTVTESDGDVAESSFSSFGLYKQADFLAVEQFSVKEGTEVETAYGYTHFSKGGYERFLLTTDSDDNESRLVYLTPMQKMVITRFEKDGKTLYALRVKIPGSMKFAGIYERVVTKDSDGTETVSYKLYSEDETKAPKED
jgi:hypothetical protein